MIVKKFSTLYVIFSILFTPIVISLKLPTVVCTPGNWQDKW